MRYGGIGTVPHFSRTEEKALPSSQENSTVPVLSSLSLRTALRFIFDKYSSEQIDARANRNSDDILVVKDPDDPMFKNMGIEMRRMDERTKTVVEEYCGIRKLEYDEDAKSISGGEINEECPEKPVLDMEKLKCLSKEELILIAPKLEGLFNTEE